MVKKSEAATTFIEYQYMWSAVRMKYFTSLLSASRLLTASTVDERSMLSFETASPRTFVLSSDDAAVLSRQSIGRLFAEAQILRHCQVVFMSGD